MQCSTARGLRRSQTSGSVAEHPVRAAPSIQENDGANEETPDDAASSQKRKLPKISRVPALEMAWTHSFGLPDLHVGEGRSHADHQREADMYIR